METSIVFLYIILEYFTQLSDYIPYEYDTGIVLAQSCKKTKGIEEERTAVNNELNSYINNSGIIFRISKGPMMGGCPNSGSRYTIKIKTWPTITKRKCYTWLPDIESILYFYIYIKII